MILKISKIKTTSYCGYFEALEAVSKLNNVSFQFEQLLLSSRESYKRIHFEAQLKTSVIDNPIAFARGGGTALPTCD